MIDNKLFASFSSTSGCALYCLLTLHFILSAVPKQGHTDEEWRGIMERYALGTFTFSTGQRPRNKKWRAELKRVESCNLTPKFKNMPVRYRDIFGEPIKCSCGYHKVSKTDSSSCKVY